VYSEVACINVCVSKEGAWHLLPNVYTFEVLGDNNSCNDVVEKSSRWQVALTLSTDISACKMLVSGSLLSGLVSSTQVVAVVPMLRVMRTSSVKLDKAMWSAVLS